MKKTYNIIIYILISLIVIVSIILLIPSKESNEEITLNIITKNLEIEQSKSKKIELNTNGNSSYRSLNTLVAIVTKDGIHFYNKEFNEEITKKVDFNFSKSGDDMGQIRMAQFSEDNGEFILILIINVLYIFDGNENELISIKLGHKIKPINYSLIPYKKINVIDGLDLTIF